MNCLGRACGTLLLVLIGLFHEIEDTPLRGFFWREINICYRPQASCCVAMNGFFSLLLYSLFSYDHRPCEGNANNVYIHKCLINKNPNLAPNQSSTQVLYQSYSIGTSKLKCKNKNPPNTSAKSNDDRPPKRYCVV